MPLTMKPTRYAHPEGHTGVCYCTGSNGGLVTCGADGDVRYWLNLMDDDPSATCIAEQAIAVISKNGKLYVGNDNNTVQILTIPNLEKAGVVTRFSAAVSALATTKDSNLIVSGSCDMRIQVTNIETSDTIELNGHEAPILGLSLDPKEKYVASSSADGSIRIWRISEKKTVYTWDDVVPKCNGFFTAKTYSTPSFNPKDGSTLAYPHGKEIVIVERDTWDEIKRLMCPELRTELSICRYSECGKRIAASSIHGEIIVWDSRTGDTLGYQEHHQNPKITTLVWKLDEPNELTFCDSLGQLGCIDVITRDKSLDELVTDAPNDQDVDDELEFGGDNHKASSESDDDENVISLNKIKTAITRTDDDSNNHLDVGFEHAQQKIAIPEINKQPPFQPGSSPVHLLSRYMVWNDVGIVKCYSSEDDEESSIEVEFHDTSIHHTMHINNYLRHTMAALSPQVLALSCPSNDGTPSKLVAVVLQGWGSGNKEWSVDLPEGEETLCLAVGDNFVAFATSQLNLRLYMIGGTQREVIGLPGAPVAMNGFKNNLVVACHTGVGVGNDQHMGLMWIKIQGANLRNQTISVPLGPGSGLSWLGMSDLAAPSIVDEAGVLKIYDKKSCLWRVACDTTKQLKAKMDHFFVIGVSEREGNIRCVLCKGSRYPPTTPRPTVNEIPIILPLCEPETEKSSQESLLWRIGSHPSDEDPAVLMLIAMACQSNVEFRAVDICEQIASPKLLELAIKYASRKHRMALANKLESIVESRHSRQNGNDEEIVEDIDNEEHDDEVEEVVDPEESAMLTPITKPTVEIKPLPMSIRKRNPFLKTSSGPALKGLAVLDTMPEKPQKSTTPATTQPSKPAQRDNKTKANKKESFVAWLAKNKSDLQEEFPDLSNVEFSKAALTRYKEEFEGKEPAESDGKKRKLSSPETPEGNVKRSAPNKLKAFLYNK